MINNNFMQINTNNRETKRLHFLNGILIKFNNGMEEIIKSYQNDNSNLNSKDGANNGN